MNVIEFYVDYFGPDRQGPFTQTELLSFTQKYYDEYAVLRLSKAIARAFEISETDMFSISRQKEFVGARQMYALFLSEYTKATIEGIKRCVGYTNHATVIHSIKTARNRIETEDKSRRIYESIKVGITDGRITIPGE